MKSKKHTILRWIPSLAISLFIVMGAIMKLSATAQMVEIYQKTGLLNFMKILGTAELLFVVLFLQKRSMKLGFYLLTAYFGGAMAVEMSQGTVFVIPAAILTVVWIAAYLREPSLFRSMQKDKAIAFDIHAAAATIL